ncbi:hypothetical protein TraAM80_09642 [Trypanosoma rangeli]|uniref:Uncharacterized protein n=1 Tax=Trypanosoma rangeli TaxID=5698 RepID=A0A3R7LZV2_TRYRA|nr:uncharacterized protein TraAM80_09642 [Trypanosoma rangeli]RNE96769.1 hypothetical protein TraAM80_09642 [Trypanosoma rangeli]|eukprot:RNE96769.1 hypothetical protein TraAM80_09642 [Trypanosoma rangeli]
MRTKRRHGHVVGLRLCLAVTLRRHRDVSRLCRTMWWVEVDGLRWQGSSEQSATALKQCGCSVFSGVPVSGTLTCRCGGSPASVWLSLFLRLPGVLSVCILFLSSSHSPVGRWLVLSCSASQQLHTRRKDNAWETRGGRHGSEESPASDVQWGGGWARVRLEAAAVAQGDTADAAPPLRRELRAVLAAAEVPVVRAPRWRSWRGTTGMSAMRGVGSCHGSVRRARRDANGAEGRQAATAVRLKGGGCNCSHG